MADTASLRIAVETKDVKQANTELDKLSKTSGKTEKQTDQLSRSFASISTVLGTVGVAALTKEFIRISDEMNLLDARLKMVSASTAEYTAQKKELLGISKETYSSISEITTLYTKLDPALKSLGATTKDVNNITESFAKGLKLGGANAVEAASATLQFAQAMGSGVLRGEEFNAIAEASPKLMKYLAEGLGVPQTALRKMAMEGELSAGRVSAALLKMTTKINEDFTQIPLTVGMATTNLKTDLAVAIEQFDKTTGATKALAETISGLSADLTGYAGDISNFYVEVAKFIKDHNDALRITIGLVGGVATAYYGFIAGGVVVKGIQGITTATLGLRAAMIALQASSPILLGISVALGVATAAYLAHDDALEKKNYSTINSIDKLVKSHDDLLKKRQEIQEDKFSLDSTQKKETAIVDAELKKIENRLNQIGTARSNNVIKAKKEAEETAKAAKVLEENAKKLAPPAKEKKAKKTDAQKEAERLAKEQADIEIFWSHEANQSKLANIQKVTDERKDAILNEEAAETESQLRRGAFIEAQQEALLSDKQKLNRDYLSAWEQMESENAALIAQGLEPIFNDEQMQTFFTKWQASIDEVKGGYNDVQGIVSTFVEDSLNSKDWTAGLTGTAKSVANLGNAFKDLDKQNKKYYKAVKSVNESQLTDEEKKVELKKIEEGQLSAQVGAYANLAGAAAGFFEEGSKGAKTMQAVSATLGIAQGIQAIISAWGSAPFPANMPAVAATTAAVLPMIAQLTSLGGSGGGGGSAANSISSGNNFDYNRDTIEANYTPMTDRLDRQIQLLESIDRNGSASQLGVQLAGTSFQRDYLKWVEDLLESSRLNAATFRSAEEVTNLIGQIESRSGVDVYTISQAGDALTLNTNVLREGFNAINAVLATLQTGGYGTFGQADITNWGNTAEAYQQMMGSIRGSVNELQNIIQEWAMGVVESMDDLKDASKDFKGYFDDITGSMYYETTRLSKAFKDIDMLRGENTFAEYLQQNINEIDALQKFFTDETFSLLMSDNIDNIQAQIKSIEELSAITGETFEGGAKEALNYLESIQLVSEAMTTSRTNIDSFIESLRTSEESAAYLASTIGVSLASNVDELSLLFNRLSTDTEGLTDKDLDLLTANKELLENTDELQKSQDDYNKTLQETTQAISTLDGVLGIITSTIEKLRSASRTSEQNLQVFYDAMAEAQRLSKTDDYAGYAEAVKKAADTSSALFNKDNFTLQRDMEYAQLVAANQFEELGVTTETQVDYLKQIEINTRTQIDVLVAAMEALGTSISESLRNNITSTTTNPLINTSYQDILGRAPDEAGASYWSGQLSSGTLNNTNIDNAIATAAIPEIYQSILGRAPDAAGAEYWANQLATGAISPDKIDDAIRAAAIANGELSSFAVGTPYVPSDMIAQIHQGEMIVPKPEAEAWRNGSLVGNNNALIAEIQSLRTDVSNLLKVNNSYQEKIDRNTKPNLFQGVN